ncbi:hypothetical protein [Paraburkholderia sp. BL18I3N2]|uniref:hypothetical protein n=1 Tax=Paraburkholderia sp. BL18I3N2 TaxID=1938799 RepID=UPI0015E7629F|nr:hypothetical protein [Paraburkholderia sp. BL18I3N2]
MIDAVKISRVILYMTCNKTIGARIDRDTLLISEAMSKFRSGDIHARWNLHDQNMLIQEIGWGYAKCPHGDLQTSDS